MPRDKSDSTKGRFKLYTHQLDMLKRGVQPAMPGIVTSGTGSGKTESFLLPVLAQIVKEASGWPKSPSLKCWQPWWHNGVNTQPTFMREAEASARPKAVRALILYPMNALVEDQMVRMRRALDSREAHEAMDLHLGGNRIFFWSLYWRNESHWMVKPSPTGERGKEKKRKNGSLVKSLNCANIFNPWKTRIGKLCGRGFGIMMITCNSISLVYQAEKCLAAGKCKNHLRIY
ncbi:DEAD/DEAH box helicase [Klebsiella pneumoniae]